MSQYTYLLAESRVQGDVLFEERCKLLLFLDAFLSLWKLLTFLHHAFGQMLGDLRLVFTWNEFIKSLNYVLEVALHCFVFNLNLLVSFLLF